MEHFRHNPAEEQTKKPAEKLPTLEIPTTSEPIIVKNKEHSDVHPTISEDFNVLSDTSKELYGKFLLHMIDSKRSGGGAIQDALLTFGTKHSIPPDLKMFIAKTYGDQALPEATGSGTIFLKKIDSETAEKRKQKLARRATPPKPPTRLGRLWDILNKPLF
jgi:hypothetical protein